jgi:hypothetical protein
MVNDSKYKHVASTSGFLRRNGSAHTLLLLVVSYMHIYKLKTQEDSIYSISRRQK